MEIIVPWHGKIRNKVCRFARKASLARPAAPAAIDLAFALRLRLELGTRLFHTVENFWGGVVDSVWGKKGPCQAYRGGEPGTDECRWAEYGGDLRSPICLLRV